MVDKKGQQLKIRPVWIIVIAIVGAAVLGGIIYGLVGNIQAKSKENNASISFNDVKVDNIGQEIISDNANRVQATVEVCLSDCAVTVGTVFRVAAIVTPADTERALVWSSNDTGIFEVGHDGVVTVKGVGTAVLTATVGNVSDSVIIEGISQVTDGSSNNLPIYNVAQNEVTGGNGSNGGLSGGSNASSGSNLSGESSGNSGNTSGGNTGNNGSSAGNGSTGSSGSIGGNGGSSGSNLSGGSSGNSGNTSGGNAGNSGNISDGNTSNAGSGAGNGNSGNSGNTSGGSGSTGGNGDSGGSSGNNGGTSGSGSGNSGSGSGENTDANGTDSTEIGEYLPDYGFDREMSNVYVYRQGDTYQGEIITQPNVTIIYIMHRSEEFDGKVKEVLAKLLPKEHGQVWNNYVTANSDRTFTAQERTVRIVVASNGGHSQIVIYN